MKRKDIPIIILTLLLSAVLFFTISGGNKVKVSVDGKVMGEYPLDTNRTIEINKTNTLVIKDGKAFISEASCPDKLCIKQGEIDSRGGSIICLPNKVVIETKSGADAVSR